MVELADDEGPRQEPKLTELEAARAYAQASRHRALEWLMAVDEPDPAALLAQLFNRPAWHARAACSGADPALFFPTTGESTEGVVSLRALRGPQGVSRRRAVVRRLGWSECSRQARAATGRGVIVVVTTVVTDSP